LSVLIFVSFVSSVVNICICSDAHATALLVCPGSDGVVVSADSRGASLKGEVQAYDKLHVVGERVVVAAAGLLTIRDRRGIVFDVHAFIGDATRRLSPQASATDVAHALSAAARKKLPSLLEHPSVTRAPHPQLVLLVVGLDGGASTIVRVLAELRPLSVSEKPLTDPMVGIGLGPQHLSPQSVVFDFLRKRHQPVDARTLEERITLCGAILDVESRLNPTVGPPILQAILRPAGAVERTTWAAPPVASPSPDHPN
jgi:hypothetical protein